MTDIFAKWNGEEWETLVNCPIESHAVVVYDNAIHALGDCKHAVWAGAEWTVITPWLMSFYETGRAVVYDNYIYTFYNSTWGRWNGTSWENLANNTFTTLASVVVVYKNQIHVLNGTNHLVWDGVEWTDKGTPPESTAYNAGYAVFQNGIHIIGGKTIYSASTYSQKHYVYREGTYVELSPSVDLGETADSAFPGDKGKIAYDDSQANKTAIGDLSELETTDKTDLVSAINEVVQGGVVGGVSGVKGDAETDYRTGDVNLTPANIGAIALSAKGAVNGVAELDANGIIITSQLPSYVDDVVEYNTVRDFPSTGESGKIYVATSTNLAYRWSGTGYVEISPTLALGETSSTAYRGDRGKIAYDDSQTNKTSIGTLSSLATTVKTDLVSAINEVVRNAPVTGVKGNSESSYRTGNVNITKANIGLSNVEDKSSATIRSELTSTNVTTALGYTPANKDNILTKSSNGTAGQFAVSDGLGGVTWVTMVNGEEVQY